MDDIRKHTQAIKLIQAYHALHAGHGKANESVIISELENYCLSHQLDVEEMFCEYERVFLEPERSPPI